MRRCLQKQADRHAPLLSFCVVTHGSQQLHQVTWTVRTFGLPTSRCTRLEEKNIDVPLTRCDRGKERRRALESHPAFLESLVQETLVDGKGDSSQPTTPTPTYKWIKATAPSLPQTTDKKTPPECLVRLGGLSQR